MPAFRTLPRPIPSTLAGDLTQLKAKVLNLHQTITDHNAHVTKEKDAITAEVARMRASILAGETTGDRIMDYVLVRCGFHPGYYQRLARCQKAILGHAGQLVVVGYNVATEKEGQLRIARRFLCGLLSDDQLILEHGVDHGPYLPTSGKHMSEKRAPSPDGTIEHKMSLEPLDIHVAKAVALAGSEADHVEIIVGTDQVRRWFKTNRTISIYSVCVTALGRKDLALPDLKVL